MLTASRLRLAAAAIACVLAAAAPARADDGSDDDEPHVAWALSVSALKTILSGSYYWHTQSAQEVDWTYPSWGDKLSLRAVRFDTNPFPVNAIRHPLTGATDYLIGRSNNLGVLGSLALSAGNGLVWEYFVEYREDPSLNDLIMNPAGGIGIGEPFYQIGQLWRGGELSYADRLRTLAFSPFDAVQDTWRRHAWYRPRAWADFHFSAGAARHASGSWARDELALGVDIDVVRHPQFTREAASTSDVATGAWSRVQFQQRFGDAGAGTQTTSTLFHSRTSLGGKYIQDADGDGAFLGASSGFTYRHERLEREWDRLVLAHLLGAGGQLSRRTGSYELRWDTHAWADFGMIEAHVFGPVSPLTRPPPLLSTLQAEGYYDGAGATLQTRVRLDRGHVHADLELAATQLWSLDFADRAEISSAQQASRTVGGATVYPETPHGVSDQRVFAHGALGYREGAWGVEATLDGAYRRGTWSTLERSTTDYTVGLAATANY